MVHICQNEIELNQTELGQQSKCRVISTDGLAGGYDRETGHF